MIESGQEVGNPKIATALKNEMWTVQEMLESELLDIYVTTKMIRKAARRKDCERLGVDCWDSDADEDEYTIEDYGLGNDNGGEETGNGNGNRGSNNEDVGMNGGQDTAGDVATAAVVFGGASGLGLGLGISF